MIGALITWLIANYLTFIPVYVGGGAAYALLKWVIQLIRLRYKVLDINARTDIPEDNSAMGHPFDNKSYLRDQAARKLFGSDAEYPPNAAESKGKLFGWALFWPINLVYTLFADVAREAWNFLYRKFGAILDFISRMILPK